ncbi:MAG: AmpG family muropeptide MFS transporter [Opitutaceae bacterium]|nr:AmpG family muropeptide MFS transporter [Opitutaceae bacterium]
MTPDATPARAARAWRWIPTLYFGQGIPYVVVMTLSVVMYKNLQVSNTDIALYTSWLYLPWVIKPLWSPLVDLFRTKRGWIVTLQLVIGAALASVALTVPGPAYFQATLAVFWLMAFSSATHDIAADGFYLLALPPHQQAAFVGVRSTCYRLAMIAGQGGLVYLAGALQAKTGSVTQAWAYVFWLLAGFFVLLGGFHALVLPRPAADRAGHRETPLFREFLAVFASFFRKKEIGTILGFLLLYRFAEAQLLKLVTPFLLDAREVGGLGLTTQQVGILYGTIGVIALTVGGLIGGLVISRFGLGRLRWPMVFCMHVPNLVFIFLGLAQPGNLYVIGGALALEQFGYGFGFTAYLLYMMMVAEGENQTAHYAICTGFMALGMMLPGMAAGWIQDQLGYVPFFVWVCVATIPSFVATGLIKVDPQFGRKA